MGRACLMCRDQVGKGVGHDVKWFERTREREPITVYEYSLGTHRGRLLLLHRQGLWCAVASEFIDYLQGSQQVALEV